MDMLKALCLGALVAGTIAVVLGSQGSNGGPLAVEAYQMTGKTVYWSWPLFFAGSGLFFGLFSLSR